MFYHNQIQLVFMINKLGKHSKLLRNNFKKLRLIGNKIRTSVNLDRKYLKDRKLI